MNRCYIGVKQRSFQNALIQLLETDYGILGSRRVLELLAEDIARLATHFHPDQQFVQPGWIVFTGTKVTGQKAHPGKSAGDYPLVTLAWPLLLPEDIETMLNRPPGQRGRQAYSELTKKRLQRLVEHGLDHPQGPVALTNADLGLMLGRTNTQISRLLKQLRQETGKPLLTKGYFFDQGSRPTHKAEIVTLYEQGMDEADIAFHTRHAQSSVGNYLRDYERVKLLLKNGFDLDQIGPMIEMRPSVVNAYVKLIQQYHPNLLSMAELSPAI